MGFGNFNALHSFKVIDGGDLADFLVAVPVNARARIAHPYLPADIFPSRYVPRIPSNRDWR